MPSYESFFPTPISTHEDIELRLAELAELEALHPFRNSNHVCLPERLRRTADALTENGLDNVAFRALCATTLYLTREDLETYWQMVGSSISASVGTIHQDMVKQCAFFQCDGEDHITAFQRAAGLKARQDPEIYPPYNTTRSLEKLRASILAGERLSSEERRVLRLFLERRHWVLLWDLNLSGKTVVTELKRLKRYAAIFTDVPVTLHLGCAVITNDAITRLHSADIPTDVTIHHGLKLDQSAQVGSDHCKLFGPELRKRVDHLCTSFFDTIMRSSDDPAIVSYLEKNGSQFGYCDGGWTIITSENAPNNSVPLFWVEEARYAGPYPRVPSRISHLSLAARELDNLDEKQLMDYRRDMSVALYVEGVLDRHPANETKLPDGLKEAYLKRITGDGAHGKYKGLLAFASRIYTVDPEFLVDYLVPEIDRMLRAKERDFGLIGRLVSLVAAVIKDDLALFDSLPGHELLFRLSQLWAANNEGRMTEGTLLIDRIKGLEVKVREDDPSLALHSVFIRAMHATNALDFDTAWEIASPFEGIVGVNALEQGKVLSCLGQVEALRGRYVEAARYFERAMSVIRKMTDGRKREQELAQIAVYAEINAMDSTGFPCDDEGWRRLTEEANMIGCSLHSPYKHHLLVRGLWKDATRNGDAIRVYLSSRQRWQSGLDFPYPLINFYRGLLLLRNGDVDAAGEYVSKAVEQSLWYQQGETIRYIGLVLAAVAHHLEMLHEDNLSYVSKALHDLRDLLPLAYQRLDDIEKAFRDAPCRQVPDFFYSLLPFYFR